MPASGRQALRQAGQEREPPEDPQRRPQAPQQRENQIGPSPQVEWHVGVVPKDLVVHGLPHRAGHIFKSSSQHTARHQQHPGPPVPEGPETPRHQGGAQPPHQTEGAVEEAAAAHDLPGGAPDIDHLDALPQKASCQEGPEQVIGCRRAEVPPFGEHPGGIGRSMPAEFSRPGPVRSSAAQTTETARCTSPFSIRRCPLTAGPGWPWPGRWPRRPARRSRRP